MSRVTWTFMLLVALAASVHAQGAPVDRAPFDAAFDAMVRGDFAAAARGFHGVEASGPPELRGQAAELARLADAFVARGARLVSASAPGTKPPDGGVSEDDAPEGGRTSFIVTTTFGAFYSGIVAVDLLDIDDVRAGTALVMGATAAGVVGSVFGTRGRVMTGGMADAWGLGMMIGVGNGLLLSEPLGFYRASSNASEKVQTLTLGAAWGGATAGLLIADQIKPTRAQVNVATTFSLMGVGSTLLTLAIIQPNDLDGDAFTTITALGLDGGLGAGCAFAAKLDWSNSRARLVQLSAFLGAVAGGGTSLLLLADSSGADAGRAAAAITLAGLWGGFALGTYVTRDMEPDYRFRSAPPAGPSVTLAPAAIPHGGGLAALGRF